MPFPELLTREEPNSSNQRTRIGEMILQFISDCSIAWPVSFNGLTLLLSTWTSWYLRSTELSTRSNKWGCLFQRLLEDQLQWRYCPASLKAVCSSHSSKESHVYTWCAESSWLHCSISWPGQVTTSRISTSKVLTGSAPMDWAPGDPCLRSHWMPVYWCPSEKTLQPTILLLQAGICSPHSSRSKVLNSIISCPPWPRQPPIITSPTGCLSF